MKALKALGKPLGFFLYPLKALKKGLRYSAKRNEEEFITYARVNEFRREGKFLVSSVSQYWLC